jgi:hypothetical protein
MTVMAAAAVVVMVVMVVEMAQHEKGPSYSVTTGRMLGLRVPRANTERG